MSTIRKGFPSLLLIMLHFKVTQTPLAKRGFSTGPLPPKLQQRAVILVVCDSQRRLDGNRAVKLGILQLVNRIQGTRRLQDPQLLVRYFEVSTTIAVARASSMQRGWVDLHPKSNYPAVTETNIIVATWRGCIMQLIFNATA